MTVSNNLGPQPRCSQVRRRIISGHYTYLYGIHDAGGNFLPGTEVNDGGYGGNSRLWFKPNTGGTYYVAAGAHYPERWGYARDEGSYTVAVTDLTPGAGLVAAAAVGRPATGSIDFEYERDWFGVTLEAGRPINSISRDSFRLTATRKGSTTAAACAIRGSSESTTKRETRSPARATTTAATITTAG